MRNDPPPDTSEAMGLRQLPATAHAIQLVDKGSIVHNRAKPVPRPGPRQVVVRMEACGICFSDTKLLHAFADHPRKSAVLAGMDAATLAEIASYVPGRLPTVPGHEPVGRIVAVGGEVERHRVGERVLIQTDYRQLPTVSANAAFGYDFEGGLQQYVLLDERVIIEPATGSRFLIPASEAPSASAIALVEPWACVEASYVRRERRGPLPGGRLLIALDEGHRPDGLPQLLANAAPSRVTGFGSVEGALGLLRAAGVADGTDDLTSLPRQAFDDIVYFGADASVIESLQVFLAPSGLINIVTAGTRIARPAAVDVGRVHYDLTRWTGTRGSSALDGYAGIPMDGEVREGEAIAVVGAAGPMGLMHVVRAATSGCRVSISAVDIDDSRLAHLDAAVNSIARERGVELRIVNSRVEDPGADFSYVALMVPAPALVGQALSMAAPGARINIFAGFATGTRAEIDLDAYLEKHCYLLGTSGSGIPDMEAVLRKLEDGILDTNISLDAVAGFEGVADALAAVEGRTSEGKIMVYPSLPELGLVRIADLADRFPTVAARLAAGRWTKEAEAELLRVAGAETREA